MSNDQAVKETQEVKAPPVVTEQDQTNSDAPQSTEQTPQPISEDKLVPIIYEKSVDLGASGTVLVKKLKAGPYYKAQKLYAEWLGSLEALITNAQKTFSGADLNIQNEDGTPNTKKLEAVTKKLAKKSKTAVMFAFMAELDKPMEIRKRLTAVGVEMTEEDFDNKFYPEDIDLLFENVVLVNNFMENLKKSVSHMGVATIK